MSDPMCSTERMNKATTRNRAVKTKNSPRNRNESLPGLEQLAEVSASQVEHRTVLEFLRGIPHKWHPDEIARFGDKVKRMAEALQLPFVPSINPSLGVIRTYPVPLMEWVYTVLAQQFHWPAPALVLEDGARAQREELRRHEGTRRNLELAAADHAPSPEVSAAIKVVLDWMDAETARLKGSEAEATKGQAPLRVV
jgi:hypothetical protein